MKLVFNNQASTGLRNSHFTSKFIGIHGRAYSNYDFSQHSFLEPLRAPSPVPVRSSTPPCLDIPDRPLSPAWNPAAPPPTVPLPPAEPDSLTEPRWLAEPEFAGRKIFLREDFGRGYLGFFKGIVGDNHVRFLTQSATGKLQTLPMSCVRHVVPKSVNDLVVPISGDFKGRVMRVQKISINECTLSEVGKRRRSKKYVPPVIETTSLARIVS